MAIREPPTLADLRAPYDAYERWIGAQGIPIHRGYYIEDARTVELGWWERRGCQAAFLVLSGQEGVSETRITAIRPGATLPAARFALDELVYVVEGRGLTTIWAGDGPPTTFEWQKHSLFMLPRDHTYQLSNAQGANPARLMHVNYLPSALNLRADVEFFLDESHPRPAVTPDIYSEAKAVLPPSGTEAAAEGRLVWYGNFFPDLRAWDRLDNYQHRGAGGFHMNMQFPNSIMNTHMSVFPTRTYKKGHRHGPGVVIVIPAGEGYSVMWPEGAEKVTIPWREASVFVPPNRWFHQHFNLGAEPARYLAFHAPRVGIGMDEAERIQNRATDQIEYPNEEPWIRQKFEEELGKRGLISLMPDEAYRSLDYRWSYGEK